ncbi:hypothetical protein [Prevotella sp.]|uniref:hypothetical protein n=1 Tax=Prevotella sp. TaxID=59823 RepID=UPI003DA60E1F
MKRIIYPTNAVTKDKFEGDYKAIFSTNYTKMQGVWEKLCNQLRDYSQHSEYYPDDIQSLFISPYHDLVDVYIDYITIKNISKKKNDSNFLDLHKKLVKLFNYSGERATIVSAYQPRIAKFFMDNSDLLNIHSCFYCETSYINSYGFNTVYQDFGDFLLNATEEKICYYIRSKNGNVLSDSTIKKIMELRNNSDRKSIVINFDKLGVWRHGNPSKSKQVKGTLYNHFDLDHFLPKGECPLVALSLYNFVPSCSVCNEKLKHSDRVGGLDKNKLLRFSPTSDHYKFDNEISIVVTPNPSISTLRAQMHDKDFKIEFLPNGSDRDYLAIVNEFRLEERYNYHKKLALKRYDLYHDYSDATITAIKTTLGDIKTEEDIKEDIFGERFINDNNRCFGKLIRDIKKQCQNK